MIDAMGRDDADLTWSGFFSGASAADRARMVDQMRAEGGQLTLIWDAFCYDVIIRRFEVDYRNPFWLPYRIICTVVWDEAQANADLVLPLSTSILGDLAVAAGYGIDVTQAQSAWLRCRKISIRSLKARAAKWEPLTPLRMSRRSQRWRVFRWRGAMPRGRHATFPTRVAD